MQIKYKRIIITSFVSFLAGLLVYDLFIVDLWLATKVSEPQTLEIECLGEQFVGETMQNWEQEFFDMYPDATLEERITDWNKRLRSIGCDGYQVTVDDVYYNGILSDLMRATTTNEVICPTHDEFSEVFLQWFSYFTRAYPTGTDKALMEGWDGLMVQSGCTELVDPFNGELPPS